MQFNPIEGLQESSQCRTIHAQYSFRGPSSKRVSSESINSPDKSNLNFAHKKEEKDPSRLSIVFDYLRKMNKLNK